ncbi:MAG: cysteine--tRNA ligase [Endomicrobiales bacterium]
MTLMIYNTLTFNKEPFIPAEAPLVSMYVCGVTPYDEVHLGHARAYVTFDIVRRHLEHSGYQVKYIQNFTDVDDKIINRARERGISPRQLADQYIADYFTQIDKLSVKRASAYPRVTEQIPQIVKFIAELIDKKYAYAAKGDVYYRVNAFKGYGKLSKRNIDELQTVARIESGEHKKDPLDFALWKAAKPDEPAEVTWDSPWGKGRPGWHIECSVMSTGLLGSTIDIHGGGQDLIFPHHENEIAQSEAYTGKQFVRFWIHNGFVTINREKMSKSLGNFFTLRDIFDKYHPRIVRYFLLSQHYRTPLDFSDEKLQAAAAALQGLDNTLRIIDEKNKPSETFSPSTAFLDTFNAALDDDFNTEKALAVVHSLKTAAMAKVSSLNSGTPIDLNSEKSALHSMLDRLGIALPALAVIPDDIRALAEARVQARREKNWAQSDELRKKIDDRGYKVEDNPNGSSTVIKR